jgi:DNA-binding NtrC family response regulator
MAGADLPSFHGIIGRSAPMQALFREMEDFASSSLPVLIRGESGTGKELVAAAIQRLSGRRARGFQIINCADLTPELLRSELFGHERGAFTGAVGKKEGLLTRVDGGTVFLDEIGELTPRAQTMLLRFLQAGEGLAVGATRGTRVDVRVIAATHRDLEAAVEEGSFREDFYYRLWGAVLEVPALRARREDIPLLVEHFRVRCNREDQLAVDGFTRQALAVLEADPWPGNVRELERVVHRAMAVRRRGVVQPEDVRLPSLRRAPPAAAGVEVSGTAAALSRYAAAALQLAGAGGGVRRGELMAHCGISREAARRTLASLVGRRLLRRLGSGRGTWYVLQTPDGTVDEPDELASLIAARRGGSLPAAPMATRGPR